MIFPVELSKTHGRKAQRLNRFSNLLKLVVLAVILVFLGPGHFQSGDARATSPAEINKLFQSWLATDIWPEAKRRGVSAADFNSAFAGVTPNLELPDLIIPGAPAKVPKQQRQAEFRSPADYFAENVVMGVVRGGKTKFSQHAGVLNSIERKTGVPGRILLAIWGRESAFGNAKIPYNAFEVLGTKAFMSTRKDYFRSELLAALEMVAKSGIPVGNMQSSWAGALGQPQFMPSSFLEYAEDFDGDRIADIWKSVPDTLGSIGSYLGKKGWVSGRDWGFEVKLPKGLTCALEGPDQGRKISSWVEMGIRRINDRPFPAHEMQGEGYLMLPAGTNGPAFLVTPNFYVIKEYNKSDLYALFVGHAGDRIEYGSMPFTGTWVNTPAMYRSDIASIQRDLENLGYDVGGADGLPGFKTRRSIGDWQAKNGLTPTCFPEPDLKNKLGK